MEAKRGGHLVLILMYCSYTLSLPEGRGAEIEKKSQKAAKLRSFGETKSGGCARMASERKKKKQLWAGTYRERSAKDWGSNKSCILKEKGSKQKRRVPPEERTPPHKKSAFLKPLLPVSRSKRGRVSQIDVVWAMTIRLSGDGGEGRWGEGRISGSNRGNSEKAAKVLRGGRLGKKKWGKRPRKELQKEGLLLSLAAARGHVKRQFLRGGKKKSGNRRHSLDLRKGLGRGKN